MKQPKYRTTDCNHKLFTMASEHNVTDVNGGVQFRGAKKGGRLLNQLRHIVQCRGVCFYAFNNAVSVGRVA